MALFNENSKPIPEAERELKPAAWYDENYYRGNGGKSNWQYEYSWNYYGAIATGWAKFIYEGFPEAQSFLDAGCGKGFLVKALLKLAEANKFKRTVEGFDHSEYAIASADEEIRPLLTCAGIDDFTFTRRYDLLICCDMLEHVTEDMARRFLTRSRAEIDDCFFGIIALDTPKQRREPSHVTLESRAWWTELFVSCGWVFDREMQTMLRLAQREFLDPSDAEIFIFKSGHDDV